MSYNHLKFDQNFIYVPKDLEDFVKKSNSSIFAEINSNFTAQQKIDLYSSMEFVDKLNFYLKKDRKINHIDLSGMQYDSLSFVKLSNTMSQMPTLSSVHLNDLGLKKNDVLAKDLLDIFGV